jgi:anaerobic selenocysteine-containing dehydrogenase
VQIEPKMSISGAAADKWIPATPGSEGVLALGIAHQLLAGGAYSGVDSDAWSAALADYTLESVAARTGVPADTIAGISDQFGHADHGLAIGGGAAGTHSNGADTLVAVNVLNYLVGNIGKSGGVVFNPDPASGGSASQHQATYQSMQSLVQTAQQGGIDVLIVNNTNPVFTMPQAAEFKEALASIPFIVSLSSFMDETTAMADVILPSHTYLESWGDDMPQPGVGFSVGAVSQPVVSPLYNTRATGDIVLDLAHRLELGGAMPWANMEDCVKDGWRQIYERGPQESGDFASFWRDVLTSGVWGEDVRRNNPVAIDASVIADINVSEAEFAGDGTEYPFFLHPFVTTAMYDGRGANLPWMQELPEPMTSIVYGSWVEINPATASKLGIKDGDLLRITSEQGSIDAPAVIFPAIMPDVIAMPIGQGHDSFGRYARHRGVNPIQILAPKIDSTSGSLASSATRVSVTATGKRADAVRIGGEARQLGRGIVQSTGGNDAEHSASLNSIPIVVESA